MIRKSSQGNFYSRIKKELISLEKEML